MFCTFKGEGTGAVRHMFSNHILKPEKTPLENSVWGTSKSSGTFSTLFKSRLLRAKEYLDHPFEIKPIQSGTRRTSTKVVCSSNINLSITDRYEIFKQNQKSALVLNGDSAPLDIPDASVDAVVTDPLNIDAIMVCKKATIPPIKQQSVWSEAMKRFKQYHDRFHNAQRTLSLGDRHVMMASQILVYSSTSKLAYPSVERLLEQVFQSELAYSANKVTQTTSAKSVKVVQMSLFN